MVAYTAIASQKGLSGREIFRLEQVRIFVIIDLAIHLDIQLNAKKTLSITPRVLFVRDGDRTRELLIN